MQMTAKRIPLYKPPPSPPSHAPSVSSVMDQSEFIDVGGIRRGSDIKEVVGVPDAAIKIEPPEDVKSERDDVFTATQIAIGGRAPLREKDASPVKSDDFLNQFMKHLSTRPSQGEDDDNQPDAAIDDHDNDDDNLYYYDIDANDSSEDNDDDDADFVPGVKSKGKKAKRKCTTLPLCVPSPKRRRAAESTLSVAPSFQQKMEAWITSRKIRGQVSQGSGVQGHQVAKQLLSGTQSTGFRPSAPRGFQPLHIQLVPRQPGPLPRSASLHPVTRAQGFVGSQRQVSPMTWVRPQPCNPSLLRASQLNVGRPRDLNAQWQSAFNSQHLGTVRSIVLDTRRLLSSSRPGSNQPYVIPRPPSGSGPGHLMQSLPRPGMVRVSGSPGPGQLIRIRPRQVMNQSSPSSQDSWQRPPSIRRFALPVKGISHSQISVNRPTTSSPNPLPIVSTDPNQVEKKSFCVPRKLETKYGSMTLESISVFVNHLLSGKPGIEALRLAHPSNSQRHPASVRKQQPFVIAQPAGSRPPVRITVRPPIIRTLCNTRCSTMMKRSITVAPDLCLSCDEGSTSSESTDNAVDVKQATSLRRNSVNSHPPPLPSPSPPRLSFEGHTGVCRDAEGSPPCRPPTLSPGSPTTQKDSYQLKIEVDGSNSIHKTYEVVKWNKEWKVELGESTAQETPPDLDDNQSNHSSEEAFAEIYDTISLNESLEADLAQKSENSEKLVTEVRDSILSPLSNQMQLKPRRELVFYTCIDCGAQFTNKLNLGTHMRKIHNEIVSDRIRSYPCNKCGARFCHISNVYKHKKRRHAVNRGIDGDVTAPLPTLVMASDASVTSVAKYSVSNAPPIWAAGNHNVLKSLLLLPDQESSMICDKSQLEPSLKSVQCVKTESTKCRKMPFVKAQGAYSCALCFEAFYFKSKLLRHKQLMHRKIQEAYQPSEKNQEFTDDKTPYVRAVGLQADQPSSRTGLKTRSKSLKASSLGICDKASVTFSSKSHLAHSSKRGATDGVCKFSCNFCSKGFRCKSKLNSHIIEMHGTKKKQDELTEVVDSSVNANTLCVQHDHLQLSSADQPSTKAASVKPQSKGSKLLRKKKSLFSCDVCDAKYLYKCRLRAHKYRKHRIFDDPEYDDIKVEIAPVRNCDICPATYRHRASLSRTKRKEHTIVRKTSRLNVKKMPNRRLVDTIQLSPVKMATFSSKSQLAHSSKRGATDGICDFPCDFCSKGFGCRSKLNSHMIEMHGTKKEQNELTEEVECSVNANTLCVHSDHLQLSSADQPSTKAASMKPQSKRSKLLRMKKSLVFCDVCNAKYLYKSHLRAHKYRTHKIFDEPEYDNINVEIAPVFDETNDRASLYRHKRKKHTIVRKTSRLNVKEKPNRSLVGSIQLTPVKTASTSRSKSQSLKQYTPCTFIGIRAHCCNVCGAVFGCVDDVEKHKLQKHKAFCCDVCGEKFSHDGGLRRHKRRLHQTSVKASQSSSTITVVSGVALGEDTSSTDQMSASTRRKLQPLQSLSSFNRSNRNFFRSSHGWTKSNFMSQPKKHRLVNCDIAEEVDQVVKESRISSGLDTILDRKCSFVSSQSSPDDMSCEAHRMYWVERFLKPHYHGLHGGCCNVCNKLFRSNIQRHRRRLHCGETKKKTVSVKQKCSQVLCEADNSLSSTSTELKCENVEYVNNELVADQSSGNNESEEVKTTNTNVSLFAADDIVNTYSSEFAITEVFNADQHYVADNIAVSRESKNSVIILTASTCEPYNRLLLDDDKCKDVTVCNDDQLFKELGPTVTKLLGESDKGLSTGTQIKCETIAAFEVESVKLEFVDNQFIADQFAGNDESERVEVELEQSMTSFVQDPRGEFEKSFSTSTTINSDSMTAWEVNRIKLEHVDNEFIADPFGMEEVTFGPHTNQERLTIPTTSNSHQPLVEGQEGLTEQINCDQTVQSGHIDSGILTTLNSSH